ncbi:MAG: putative repeat protein (TIGR01451 family) [Cyclobacteriaceae bacterium]|jgi:uncharacterized repeat protein (TIGR01451 family)
MIAQALATTEKYQHLRKFAALLLLAFYLLAAAPEALAQCTVGTDGSGAGVVVFESCTEAKNGGNTNNIDLTYPAGINSGDLLVVSIATDGSENFSVPSGWESLVDIDNGGSNLGVMKRIADGTEVGTINFSWTSGEEVVATMMRFTGTTGETEVATNTGSSSSPQAPTINPAFTNYLALRLGAYDDDDVTVNPGTIMAAHSNINQDASGGGNGTASGSAAYLAFSSGGPSGTGDFTLTNNEGWSTATVAIEFGAASPPTPPPLGCPRFDGSFAGSQLIVFQECVEQKQGTNVNSTTISTPVNATEGDYMIAVIATDDNETLTEPAGWTVINEAFGDGNALTLGVYERFVTAAEPVNHTWLTGTTEEMYSNILLFTDASGIVISSFQNGTSTTPTAPSVDTLAENSLIVRVAGQDDDDLNIDPPDIIVGQTNISADASIIGGDVSGQSTYLNQTGTGATGTAVFSQLTDEQWRAGTIAIEPIEFRFTMPDLTASICGAQLVTLSVTDRLGNPVTSFVGTVSLSASNSASATWSGGGAGATDINDLGGGNAAYEFVSGDGGVAVFEYHNPNAASVNFGLSYSANGPVFTENLSFDPTLTVDNLCEFRIAYDDGSMGTCSSELMTISLFDSSDIAATHYTGTIDITNDQLDGDYVAIGENGPFDNGGADDGAANYIYALTDVGQLVLNFTDTTAATVNFGVVDSGNPSYLVTVDPNLAVGACKLVIAHSAESDVCSLEAVNISVRDPVDALVSSFIGTITLTDGVVSGSWTVNSATNALVNNGGGSVDYSFDLLDGGDIDLYYELNQTASVDFDATSTTPGIAAPSGGDDPILDVAICFAQITVAPQANVCSASETVTLTILDRDSVVPVLPGSYGSVTLTTSNFQGDFISTDGNPANLSNGGPDDGVAAYLFDGTEGASVDFEYSTSTVGTLTFAAAAPFITFDAAGSTEDLDVLDCEFRISFDGGVSGLDGASDVCSLPAMTIEVWNVDGGSSAIVTDYVGTVNIGATSGSWFEQGGGSPGVLTDGPPQDGSATYEFVGGDAGTVTLDFATSTSGTLNFSVTQGAISADNTSWDPDLVIALCTFRITMVDETMTACTTEDVTITAFDSNDIIATNYVGTVSISTSTLHGNWTGAGVTDTPADDNGVATVAITTGGTVTITFEDFNFEDVNVNLVAGEIVEDGAFDPDLEVTGCLPSIVSSVCFSGASGGLGSLPLSASPGPGRMVVMWVFWSDDPNARSLTGAQFNAQTMVEIGQISPATAGVGGTMNTGVGMFAIADANLPVGGLSYAGTYTFDAPTLFTPSMCLAELADVEQDAFPQPDLVTPNDGQVNTNDFGVTGTFVTTITTSANNALVLSGASSDFTQDPNSWFNDVTPDPPMSQLFFNNNDQNPVGGTSGGSEGSKSVAGLITVTDTDNQAATTSAAHIVASFNPLVAGAPEADGFVPVLLHETLSGNISYRAIGSTLRLTSNTAGGYCNFSPLGTGTTAELALPAGSTVERAFLYWAGSGTEIQSDLDIEFGHSTELPSLNAITGEELFMITGAGGGGNLDYFASYKDVTSEIGSTGNGTYSFRQLSVQAGVPWGPGAQACAGGWGLVVIYSNIAEAFRVANLFHGFQPFQNSSFTLVPRNFRMKTTDNDPLLFEPNGQITHITVEGDETLEGGVAPGEALGIQDAPGSDVFNVLTNSYNPATGDFNSTVSRPSYFLDNGPGGSNLYQFDATGGDDGAGYDNDAVVPHHPDLLPYTPDDVRELGDSWGFDVDTHYITGNDATGGLWNFAQPDAEAEQITTQYSSGQDLVLLIAEVISITNFDLADLEVFKSVSGELKVDQAQDYVLTVTNNGNNSSSGGEATGLIVVSDILPNGMTLNSVSGADWTCYTGADRFSCTFDILNDCIDYGTGTDDIGCETVLNELSTGESLPDLTANVQVGGFAFFPDESNPAKNVVRMQHNGANILPIDTACIALISGDPGLIPDPEVCRRSPQFDNKNDLDGGAIDLNDLNDKDLTNNNVDSLIANVIGLKTDLSIDKLIDGDLEVADTQTYTITVTNNGADDTNETINVMDTAPAGIEFTAAAGPGWSCTVTPGPFGNINCDYAAALSALSSAVITLSVNVTGSAGVSVTNTAQVTPGIHNFDTTNTANNTESDTSIIIAPPVASQEEFLISVSVGGNSTDIGGLVGFENEDYINYNPQTDIGTMFYDDSAAGDVDDANAVHVFKNGHIAISASGLNNPGGTSTVGSLAFQPEDIVVYDPILDTATLLFDGSAIFDGAITANHNIDAAFVKEDGRIVFSIFGDNLVGDDACISWSGPNTLCFNRGDVVQYDPADGSVSILIDAFDPDPATEIFTSEVQVNGIYIRVDDTDPNNVKEVYILSVNGTEQVGACPGCDPVPGTGVSPDDIVQVDLTGADPITQNLLVGDIPFGVFAPVDNTREIDAIHVKEDGYHGHFSISQSQAGSTCAAGQITIRKHEFNHDVDTNYVGSIEITTSNGTIGVGSWSLADGDGTLSNIGVDDGVATYTFVPSDLGEVTLFLTETDVETIDVNVTNRFVDEQEDPAFIFSNVVSDITYLDEFTAAAFGNNDGITVWASPWAEVDNAIGGAGPANGNVIVSAGSMQFTTEVGFTSSEMSRVADLGLFPITSDLVELSFDFKYSSLNSPADRFVAEVRENSGANWEEVWVWDTGGTNGVFQGSGLIDLKTAIEAVPRVWAGWSETTEIRFKVDAGYTGTSRMFIDNVKLKTGTTTCGIGVMDHYEIRIDNITGDENTLVPGISCLASQITISGHDANHVSVQPGEAVTLRGLSETLANKGTWSAPYVGTGTFVESGTAVDGLATYTFPVDETQVVLNFNYTDPTLNPEEVNFNITSAFGVDVNEDPTLQVGDVVLRIFNETQGGVNLIPTQISGKSSNVAAPSADVLTLQVITTDLTDTTQCMPLIDVDETLTFSFSLECIDDDSCNSSSLVTPVATVHDIGTGPATPVEIPNIDSNAGNGASSYADVDLTFANFPNSGIAAEIVLMYQDAGNVQLHAQLDPEINVNANNGALMLTAGAGVGTPLQASSNVFTVRPFGLDIDFPTATPGSEGRGTNGLADASFAVSADGDVFSVAGAGFNTRVRGVQYDAADDLNTDGMPDTDSELWNNLGTPNFGNDSTATAYKVQVISTTIAPVGGYGALTNNEFTTFSDGAQTHTMTFDEVGIIDLEASLLLTADDLAANYLLSGVQLTGHVRDVGRFYPASFELFGGSILSRVQSSMEAMCINPTSAFTYMGEEFQISAMLEAQNAAGVRTRNYVDDGVSADDYAKLDISDLTVGNFFIFEELVGVDTNLSTRSVLGSIAPDVTWPDGAAAEPDRGIGMLSGNLIFSRQADGSEDGPYEPVVPVDPAEVALSIGLQTSDDDGAALELGIDIDEAMPIANDVALIGTENFRYGRLMIVNTFGPETEELGIPFRIEYWNGSDWATNALDNCTVLSYNATEGDATLRSAYYVDNSWEGALDGNANGQDDGETVVENDAVIAAISDIVISVSGGRTDEVSGVDLDMDDQNDDRPLRTSAPGEGFEGSVLIEFDLNHGSLPYSLDFLSYDWRSTVEIDVLEDIEDGNYVNNPRGRVDFGTYRGHDRVINWQEIYIGPTP